jgi:hypothetical protein
MLPDRDLQLLTAFVDGELSSRQREAALRLVQQSAEARQIVKELQEHARQLQQLPARKLEPEFAESVTGLLGHQPVAKPATRRVMVRRRWPVWSRYAVAASVLAVLAGGLTWLLNQHPFTPDPGPGPIAKKPNTLEPKSRADHDSLVAGIVEGVAGEFAKPLPPERPGNKLAFDDLARTQHHQLVEGMSNKRAVHLDVVVSNHRQAVQRLETVLQNKGIKVVVDPHAEARLTRNQPKSQYVIYAENIRPDELSAMLYELGTDERARRSIEALTVSSVTDNDQKRLCELLGIPREELQAPSVKQDPFQKFIPKEGKQAPSEPARSPIAPTLGGEARVAMVLANETPSGELSSQVRYFLSQRRQLQPGALQVIVVVHQG